MLHLLLSNWFVHCPESGLQTQSWVGQTSSGGWAVLWSNPPPRNHSSLPSPLKSIVLPSSLVCIGTQWLCTWPLCFCGFSATSSIAMLLLSPDVLTCGSGVESHKFLHSSCTSGSLTVKSNLLFALEQINLNLLNRQENSSNPIYLHCSSRAAQHCVPLTPESPVGILPGSVSCAGESECHRAGANLLPGPLPPIRGHLPSPSPYPPFPSLPGSWALVQRSSLSSHQGRPLPPI